MKRLSEICFDSESLEKGLQENGLCHRSYKSYTSMEQALGFLVSGYIYLSNGYNWNDQFDKKLMDVRNVYAKCFSCSTKENIAMWMLYSGNRGKSGAMLDFPRFVMKDILLCEAIELGFFDEKSRMFITKQILNQEKDYTIYLTDVVYTNQLLNNKIALSLGDDHYSAHKTLLEKNGIFHKNYAWAYEKECRLVIKLSEEYEIIAKEEKLNQVRIRLSQKAMNAMKKDRLVRSPIYNGRVENGRCSELNGKVVWEL